MPETILDLIRQSLSPRTKILLDYRFALEADLSFQTPTKARFWGIVLSPRSRLFVTKVPTENPGYYNNLYMHRMKIVPIAFEIYTFDQSIYSNDQQTWIELDMKQRLLQTEILVQIKDYFCTFIISVAERKRDAWLVNHCPILANRQRRTPSSRTLRTWWSNPFSTVQNRRPWRVSLYMEEWFREVFNREKMHSVTTNGINSQILIVRLLSL